jgi:zinc/manganese transport system substrate-binding protein
VAPAVLKETTDLVTSGHIDLLAFNQQTSTGQTQKLREDAENSGVSVVEFSETLPEGKNYQQWMQDNIDQVSQAVK